jgi:hypothetical protein
MTRRPTTASRGWTIAGLLLATIHLGLLCSVSLFDAGRVVADWPERVPWLVYVAIPAVFAGAGLRNPSALRVAGIISIPLSVISLAGATLPLLLPALCYAIAYGTAARVEPA